MTKRPTPSPRPMASGRPLGVALGLGLLLGSASAPAHAWDPSTTHQGLLEAGVVRSALHLRWMDASELERGIFSELRVDPDALEHAELRMLQLAMLHMHADVGATPLGGPGACPPADAPASTQVFCIHQDVWEQSALAWIRLGMLAEVTPSARIAHHFLDREDREAEAWSDYELPPRVLRTRQARTNGEPAAGIATATNFAGASRSAISWLADPQDLLAPTQTRRHLELASLALSSQERDHELALALVGVGALLHVVQDLAVPAHARGDASAFFAPLSPAVGDRGLPFQEFVRVEYSRSELPGVATGIPASPPSGVPLASSILGHILGEGEYLGVGTFAAEHFFSESSVPPPLFLPEDLDPLAAAALLLGDEHHLDPVEVEGATLAPWPSERGYLLSPTGRALAAFDTDGNGRIRPYLDAISYRDQAAILLPVAVEVTRSLLDLMWPEWPAMRPAPGGVYLQIPSWASAEIAVFLEDRQGQRTLDHRGPIEIGGEALVTLPSPSAGQTLVLVLLADRSPSPRLVLERRLSELPAAADTPAPLSIQPQPL